MTVHQIPVKNAKTSEPPQTPTRLCIQCKHCDPENEFFETRCWHPENLSLVDGMPTKMIDRFRVKFCKGKYWEAKIWPTVTRRPWWKFWSK